jgi:predicted nuclease of predicted toxin-antitoxin system
MNFKLDENMPRRAVHVLISRGHDAVTVVDEGLRGSDDPLVARVAAQEGRVIITLDRRFAEYDGIRQDSTRVYWFFDCPTRAPPRWRRC